MPDSSVHLSRCLTEGTELCLLRCQPLPVIFKNAGDGVGILLHGFDFVHGKQRPAQGGNLLELGHQLWGVDPIFPSVPILPLRGNQALFLIKPQGFDAQTRGSTDFLSRHADHSLLEMWKISFHSIIIS